MSKNADREMVLNRINVWAEKANSANADHPPSLTELTEILSGRTFSRPKVNRLDGYHQPLIKFEIKAPNGSTKNRFILPIHAACARVIELKGGKISLHNPRTSDRDRFQIKLSFRRRRTQLLRTLFDAPADADLSERHDGNYRLWVPCTYVLTKRKSRGGLTRGELLNAMRNSGDAVAANAIKRLFEIADRWHGSELVGRKPAAQAQQNASRL